MSSAEDLKKRFDAVGLNKQRLPSGSKQGGEAYRKNMTPKDFIWGHLKGNQSKVGSRSKEIVGKQTNAPTNEVASIPSVPERSRQGAAAPRLAYQAPPTPSPPVKLPSPRLTPPPRAVDPDKRKKDLEANDAEEGSSRKQRDSSEVEDGSNEEGKDEGSDGGSVTKGSPDARASGISAAVPSASPSNSTLPEPVDQTGSGRDEAKKDSMIESPTVSGSDLATSFVKRLMESSAWRDHVTTIDSNRSRQATLNAARISAKTEAQIGSIDAQLATLKLEEDELQSDFSDFKGRLIWGSLYGMERAIGGAQAGVDAGRSL